MMFRITIFLILLNIPAVSISQTQNTIEGELIVQLKKGVQIEKFLIKVEPSRNTEYEIRIIKNISKTLNIWLIGFNSQKSNADFLLTKLYHFEEVINAQHNHIISQRNIPNDSLFDLQWQYINTGSPFGKADADIDADSAWNYTTGGVTALGDTIVVAIIDNGMDDDHPDMVSNLWVNRNEIPENGFDDDGNGYKDDYKGWNDPQNNDDITNTDPVWGPGGDHGTPVAGIVGAVGNNSIGVAGINWNVKLMIVVHDLSITESSVLSAYSYVLEMRKLYNETNGAKGAFVVATNSSWGINYGQPANAPIWCAMYDSLGKYGIISAGATANLNVDVDAEGDLPTACPSEYLISVTNTDMYDQKENSAGYGDTTIDLGAPGTDTYTVALNSTVGPFEAYDQFGGTSGATPHVAGAVALLYSAPANNIAQLAKDYPAATARLIKKIIMDGTDSKSSLTGKTVTGGRLNIFKSMKLLMDYNDSTTGFSISNEYEIQANDFIIYPNPAFDYVNILYEKSNESFNVRITNILGQVIENKKLHKNRLDIKNLPSGVYYLTLYDVNDKRAFVKKMVVVN